MRGLWLLGATCAVCACGSASGESADAGAGRYEVRPGIIEYIGSTMDVVQAPGAIPAGTPTTVIVLTFGGGCDEWYADDLELTADSATLIPWDRHFIPPEPGPDDDTAVACTDQQIRIEHRFSVTFDTPGDKTLHVRGRSVAPNRDVDHTLDVPLIVSE